MLSWRRWCCIRVLSTKSSIVSCKAIGQWFFCFLDDGPLNRSSPMVPLVVTEYDGGRWMWQAQGLLWMIVFFVYFIAGT
jgi:hypothetical protein